MATRPNRAGFVHGKRATETVTKARESEKGFQKFIGGRRRTALWKGKEQADFGLPQRRANTPISPLRSPRSRHGQTASRYAAESM
jgi:hypothetical protein